MWLLDPADVNIQSGAGTFTALTDVDQFADPNIAGNTIDVALINGAGSNVMLQATHDINFGVAVNIATAGVGLTGGPEIISTLQTALPPMADLSR